MSAALYRPGAGRPGLVKRTGVQREGGVSARTAFTVDVTSARNDDISRHVRAIFSVLSESQQERALIAMGWERVPVAIPPQQEATP